MNGKATGLPLAHWIGPGAVLPALAASTAEGVLEELAAGVARTVPGVSLSAVLDGFREREQLGATSLGGGVAVPHCRLAGPREVHMRVARHPFGVDFAAPDGEPVRLFFVLVAPQSGALAHLEALRAIARFLGDAGCRARALAATGTDELLAALRAPLTRAASAAVTADV